jgi:solute carrier family 12 sodium/potassium/chloride transporter 2
LKTASDNAHHTFGTFAGVFTPNVLTILGVIMYLRLGWVVGNAGLVGALLIILLAKAITLCTGLSMSSISTNIKVGAGGAFSIISKSLGLEAGGSTGVPLFFAQTLSAALYIMGFTAAWRKIFPGHSPAIVSTTAWAAMLAISYVGAKWAIRVQYVIMTIMGLSILSFLLTPREPVAEIVLVGTFEKADFWQTFAIFFPAVTGIMAGANMSGDLARPSRSIPVGTLSAIGVTLVIYVVLALVAAQVGPSHELIGNEMFMVDNAFWAPAVVAGIMGATLSSALGSIVGAPRILQALSEHRTVPFWRFFQQKSANHEPRNALIFTGILIEAALLLGNLDALATLITMFFLVTYGMLNLVVFLEQSMKIISFRPTFRIPRFVPLLGSLGCLSTMFLINPVFSIVAMTVVVVLYGVLSRKGMESAWGDIRGGLFLSLAGRAARIASRFPRHQKSWKPDLLVPVDRPALWRGAMLLIRNVIYPSGSLFVLAASETPNPALQADLESLVTPLKKDDFMASSTVLAEPSLLRATRLTMQVMDASVFRPNILFLVVDPDDDQDTLVNGMAEVGASHEMGTVLLAQHPRLAFGMQKDINLWLRDKSPNWHLALLLTLHLQLAWKGRIRLLSVGADDDEVRRLRAFLELLCDEARLPASTEIRVLEGDFREAMPQAPRADLSIFGLARDGELPMGFIRKTPLTLHSSCLFVREVGHENPLA